MSLQPDVLRARAEQFCAAVARFLQDTPERASYFARCEVFHPELLDTSLECSLRPWTDPARLVAAALDDLGPERPEVELIPPLVAHVVLAGVVPASHVQAMAYPWLLGAHVRVKAPSMDPHFPALFAAALGARVEPVTGRGTSGDAVVVVGGDGAVAAVRAHASGGAPVLAFGDRISVAWLGDCAEVDWAGLALDVGLYDQRGCLSVVEVLVAPGHAESSAASLGHALDQLPRRRLGDDEDGIRRARDLWVLEGRRCLRYRDATLFVVAGGTVEAGPLGRTVVVREVVSPLGALETLRGRLGTVVVAPGARPPLGELGRLGASRVVLPGHAQAAGPEWPHDGVSPFGGLCRRLWRHPHQADSRA